MRSDCANFFLKMQESILSRRLPEDAAQQPAARKKISDDLAAVVTRLVTHIKPQVVLEIGAHEAKFARDVKASLPGSRVVAFEANPEIHKKYEPHASKAGVEYLFQCIADENRAYEFSVPGNERAHLTMGSLLRFTGTGVFSTYVVDGMKLDDFLEQAASSNAMWIDVEGAIGSVLSGATETLKNCALLFAELEAVARWDGQMLDIEVIETLSAYGLVPILRDIQRNKWQYNVLFVKENLLSDRLLQKICFDFIASVTIDSAIRNKSAS